MKQKEKQITVTVNIATFADFIKFIGIENACKYLLYFSKRSGDKDLPSWINRTPVGKWLIDAFSWGGRCESASYWNDLDKLWNIWLHDNDISEGCFE